MRHSWLVLLVFLVSCAAVERRSRPTQQPQRTLITGPSKQVAPMASTDLHYQAGVKMLQARDFQNAFDQFVTAQAQWQGHPRQSDAWWGAIRSGIRIGRYGEVIDFSDKLIARGNWSPEALSEIYSIKYRAASSLNDTETLLNIVTTVLSNPVLSKDFEAYRQKAIEIIESRLSISQLESLSEKSNDRPLRAQAFYRLGELYLEVKDQSSARRAFGKAYNEFPESDIGVRARDLLEQLEAVRRVDPQTVGVVLPLTGRHAAISQKTLRGVQMGLGLYGTGYTPYRLAIVDSAGNPDRARRGVERLVKEDNVIAVIGSLESKTAPTVAAKTSELNVPSIALSQKAGLTEVGSTVFRNSLTSEMQIRYLVRTAMEDLGLKRFAILYPNDQYGVEYTNLFWDEVLARGGTITAAQTYSSNETDFRFPIQRLIGTFYVEDRQDEFNFRYKEWKDSQTKKGGRSTPPDDLLTGIIDFDAIFIPDSAKSLGQIAAMLAYNNVKGVRLLGTNLWNTPSVTKRLKALNATTLFIDAQTTAGGDTGGKSFVRDYKALFGEEPGIFEIQGYDSALILRQLISQGNTSRESLTQALGDLKDFPGAIGKLTTSSEREMLRPLVALTIENGEIKPFSKPKAP